jgi:hypothetical protein
MAGKTINKAFAAILKDCKAIAAEAVEDAAKKTQDDIVKEAYNCLQEYYKYKPKRYKRTYQLENAIVPVFNNNSTNKVLSIEVGVEYDPSKLIGRYRSNSWYHQTGTHWIGKRNGSFSYDSSNNGIPEPWWIVDNLLEGVHKWGDGPNEFVKDSISTNSAMEDFFNTQLPDHINEYVKNAVFNAITNRL